MRRINRQWDRIDQWFSEQDSDGLAVLPSGVSEAEITVAEAALGLGFPAALRASFLRHNGTGKMAFSFGRLASISELVIYWKAFWESLARGDYAGRINRPIGRIKKVWFSPLWIPVSTNDEGEFLFVDLDAPSGGRKGQVIDFSRSDGAVNVLTKSFHDFLRQLADDLAAGKYKLDTKRWLIFSR
jgi:cell wall assembly regulator SMI1